MVDYIQIMQGAFGRRGPGGRRLFASIIAVFYACNAMKCLHNIHYRAALCFRSAWLSWPALGWPSDRSGFKSSALGPLGWQEGAPPQNRRGAFFYTSPRGYGAKKRRFPVVLIRHLTRFYRFCKWLISGTKGNFAHGRGTV